MLTKRIIANVITFFVIAALMIFLLVVSIFRVQPRYRIAATFRDTGGVFTGQEVTYRGVTVGRVGELRVVPEGVRIELVIEETFDEIPRDAKARVMFKSAVGEQFVDLLPQSSGAPYFRDGDSIAIERTELPVQQEELLRLLNAVLQGVPPEAFGSLIRTLGDGLGGRGDELHIALAALDPITAVLARRVPELNRIAVSGDRAGAAFDRTSQDFVKGAENLAVVSESLSRGAKDLARVLQEGSVTAPELAALISIRKGELNQAIADLAQVTRVTRARIASVDETLRWLPLFLNAISKSYDRGGKVFRVSFLTNSANPPCSYGTRRRSAEDRSADSAASGQPHVENFAARCVASGQAPASDGSEGLPEIPSGSSGAQATTAPAPAPAGPLAPWLSILTSAVS